MPCLIGEIGDVGVEHAQVMDDLVNGVAEFSLDPLFGVGEYSLALGHDSKDTPALDVVMMGQQGEELFDETYGQIWYWDWVELAT